MKRLYSTLLATAALLLSACATSGPSPSRPGLQVLEGQTELPTPVGAGPDTPYLISSGDKLYIDVPGYEDLKLGISKEEVQVDPSGRIAVPIIGNVRAAGRSTDELAAEIADRLRAAGFRDPRVSVGVGDTPSRLVTVEGEVKKPGIYPMLGRMTLLKAIASAESAERTANLRTVMVFRSVGEKRYAGVYDVSAIRRGYYDDPTLYPDDLVVVGQNAAQARFQDLLLLLPALAGPIILFTQAN